MPAARARARRPSQAFAAPARTAAAARRRTIGPERAEGDLRRNARLVQAEAAPGRSRPRRGRFAEPVRRRPAPTPSEDGRVSAFLARVA